MPKMTMPEIFKSVLCKRAYRQKPGQSAGGGPLPPSAFRAILSDFGRFLAISGDFRVGSGEF